METEVGRLTPKDIRYFPLRPCLTRSGGDLQTLSLYFEDPTVLTTPMILGQAGSQNICSESELITMVVLWQDAFNVDKF